jgi:hypothetical protein
MVNFILTKLRQDQKTGNKNHLQLLCQKKRIHIRGPETTNGIAMAFRSVSATFNGVPNNGNYSLSGIFLINPI